MLIYILLLAGFIPLILGANWLVDGAAALAKRLNVKPLVIGLTVVAFGTSTPELVVNIFAAVKGFSALAFGNIVGSNICNILLILGVASLIYPLNIHSNTVWKEIPLAVMAMIMMAVLGNDAFFDGQAFSALTRIDGIVLLAFFIIFMFYSFGIAKTGGVEDYEIKQMSLAKSILLIGIGLVGLVVGGKLIVDNAVLIAGRIGIDEKIIGLTIVGVGTSLPELATSAVAAYKKQVDIAVGNVVGSNIFNVFFILGISALICPVLASSAGNIDIGIGILSGVLLFVFVFTGGGRRISRIEGGSSCLVCGVYRLSGDFR